MAVSNLIPLIILLIVVGAAGFIGYHLYLWSNELAERAGKKMEKSNVSFTKEGGLRVGVKELRDENYADKTQNVLVNVWNNAELPNYKSRLGWNKTQANSKKQAPRAAPAASSPAPSPARAPASGSNLAPASDASGRKRSTTPVPGGWN